MLSDIAPISQEKVVCKDVEADHEYEIPNDRYTQAGKRAESYMT